MSSKELFVYNTRRANNTPQEARFIYQSSETDALGQKERKTKMSKKDP